MCINQHPTSPGCGDKKATFFRVTQVKNRRLVDISSSTQILFRTMLLFTKKKSKNNSPKNILESLDVGLL
jgi:hypothetical protein